MAEQASRDITPLPESRSLRVPYAMVWPAIWVAIVTGAGLATTYIYATKGDVQVAKDALSEHARVEQEKRSAIEVQAAAAKVHAESLDKRAEKLERFIEAVDSNLRTLMIEQDIPRGRIARPKEE